jgi:hypothetical protein
MLIMPGTSLLPGGEKSPGNYTLEDILEIPKLIQILETPTGEFCRIYGEERSLTSKFVSEKKPEKPKDNNKQINVHSVKK